MKSRKQGQSQILWVTDPWDTLDHAWDTTLRLIQEMKQQFPKLPQYWAESRSIHLHQPKKGKTEIRLEARLLLSAQFLEKSGFEFGPAEIRTPAEFDQIHYRTDPPVDSSYLHPLLLLKFAEGKVINPSEILLEHNEKTEAFHLPELCPPSLISCQWEKLHAFGRAEGITVLKPLNNAQSRGIELLKWEKSSDRDKSQALLSQASGAFTTPVLLQKYLPQIQQGEKRLWFVDGKSIASVIKLPARNDFRVNIDRGSGLAVARLNRREKAASEEIAAHLRKRKIRLAAVDLIDGYVTDFNFTSPGLIPRMEALLDDNLARPIIRALAQGLSTA